MSNLLKMLLEQVEYECLIEEGRDPVEVLHYKYQHVPSNIIDKVISIDPTKKKSYSQWLLSKWNNEKETIVNNLKNDRIEKLFQHFKQHQDIQIKDFDSVSETLRAFVPEEDTVLKKSDKPTTTLMNDDWVEEVDSRLANDFDIVFNEDNWIIAVPHTYEADAKLGENMYWCTAGGRSDFARGREYYDHYLRDYGGKYYVNFDMSKGESRLGKDYPYTRYQFHFESNQFMDKEDEPVELSEIGIPESAVEFYESEGYDTSNFDNLEERFERYEEQRYNDCYQVTNELYLNTMYDEDLHYTHPDADSDFYLFDCGDDRDPISWAEIANPFENDDVVIEAHEDWFCAIKEKYRDSILLVNYENNYGGLYKRPYTYDVIKYIALPNYNFVFGINVDDNNRYTIFSSNGSKPYENLEASDEVAKMFINEQCTRADKNGRTFIESIDEGHHALFAISSDDFTCIVKRDEPVNGESFTINENGLVEGTFRSYRVYEDSNYEQDDNYVKYDLVQVLDRDTYLISTDEEVDGESNKNILRRGETKPLINVWFDMVMKILPELYVLYKQHQVGFFNKDGQQIGLWYETYGTIDEKNSVVAGKYNNGHYHIANKDGVIAVFDNILFGSFNNKIIVSNNNEVKIYDYIEQKFCFDEIKSISRFSNSVKHMYLCDIEGYDNKSVFDFTTQRVIATDVTDVDIIPNINIGGELFKVIKSDGKCNAISVAGDMRCEVLPFDVDAIYETNSYMDMITFRMDGKNFVYDYKNNRALVNENGVDADINVTLYGAQMIMFGDNNCTIMFKKESDNVDFYKWETGANYNRSLFDRKNYVINEQTPQSVIDLYNKVTGQNVQPQQPQQPQQQPQPSDTQSQETPSYSMAEEFRRVLRAINESMKIKNIL